MGRKLEHHPGTAVFSSSQIAPTLLPSPTAWFSMALGLWINTDPSRQKRLQGNTTSVHVSVHLRSSVWRKCERRQIIIRNRWHGIRPTAREWRPTCSDGPANALRAKVIFERALCSWRGRGSQGSCCCCCRSRRRLCYGAACCCEEKDDPRRPTMCHQHDHLPRAVGSLSSNGILIQLCCLRFSEPSSTLLHASFPGGSSLSK